MHTYNLFVHGKGYVYEKKNRRRNRKKDKKVNFDLNALTNEYNQLHPTQAYEVLKTVSRDTTFVTSTPCFVQKDSIVVYPDIIKEFVCDDHFYIVYHLPLRRGLYYTFSVLLFISYICFFLVFIAYIRKYNSSKN